MNALTQLTIDIDERSLADAAGAESDIDMLAQVLSNPAATRILDGADPLAAARLRGARARRQLLEAEGGLLRVGRVSELFDISRQAVDKRRRAGRLIGVRAGRREWGYPAWQFASGGTTIPNLETVLLALRGHDPLMQIAFFLSGNVHLDGESPLGALRSGRLDSLMRAAEAYGERGAS